jgi:peptide-methionine (S)-S-oxide reductase
MSERKLATFAAGCFWGVEALFGEQHGVLSTLVGYIGGNTLNPSYEEVCTGRTNHAEAVQIEFDPQQIGYEDLVKLFFDIHDPTTLNRQGPDIGTQYRSAIFYHDESQKSTSEKIKNALDGARLFPKPIVTEITQATVFYPAEDYHQKYFAKRGIRPTCHNKR